MKTQAHTNRRGAALVLVLIMLVLLVGLVVALLQSVRTDAQSSAAYSRASETRILADSALNLIIGQLQSSTENASQAWISQPGLIRTFDSSGDPVRAYKLYSSSVMQVDGEFDPASDVPRSDWVQFPNLYTDLNEPILREGRRDFPIIDANTLTASGILDENADGVPDIQGFSVTNMAYAKAGEQLAMPVEWLYQLRDGSLASATASAGTKIQLKKLDGSPVTSENPPVARLAFWTDDESCKVNINTASDGAYWDTPFCMTFPSQLLGDSSFMKSPTDPRRLNRPSSWDDKIYETDLAMYQPANNEYQRYPGHPATTSLFPILGDSIARSLSLATPLSTHERAQVAEKILEIAPRYSGGSDSSQAGTKRAIKPISPGLDRLFATTDEYLYAAEFTGGNRTQNEIAPASVRKELIEKTRFFLTASSRSPETNLFNKPRVATWPIPKNPGQRTAFDKLIAHCATVRNGNTRVPFYFSRSNPLSTTEDLMPGTANDRLFGYLKNLIESPFPGIGGTSFSSKHNPDGTQILTEIFDYIRILNLVDVTPGATPYTSLDPRFQGMVLPIIPSGGNAAGTRGFGRFPTLSELALVVMYPPRLDKDFKDHPTNASELAWVPDSDRTSTLVHVALIPEIFTPALGFSPAAANLRLVFEGLENIKINGIPVIGQKYFPSYYPEKTDLSSPVTMRINRIPQGDRLSPIGGVLGLTPLLLNKINPDGSPTEDLSPPPMGEVEVPGSAAVNPRSFTITGGTVKVHLESPSDGGVPTRIQTFEFHFPDLQIPFIARTGPVRDVIYSSGPRVDYSYNGRTFSGVKFHGLLTYLQTGGSSSYLVSRPPVIRSIVPIGANTKGDLRIVAATENAGNLFAPHADYLTPIVASGSSYGTTGHAHTLRDTFAATDEFIRGTGSLFVDGGTPNYFLASRPDVPKGVNGVNGDWDSGVGIMPDGPYINKADEGTSIIGGTGKPTDGYISYFGEYGINSTKITDPTLFSPNRQMPSPVMFGSLPTGVKRGLGWQTLLFRPLRSYLPGGVAHPGGGRPSKSGAHPADHLILDLFWMPVVEPYAISEPFSTAGKINLNYQIAPFTYIRRDTGIRAVLENVRIPALPTKQAVPVQAGGTAEFVNRYKSGEFSDSVARAGVAGISIREPIDLDATLKFFEQRFATGSNRPFISSSEICDIPFVPKGLASFSDTPSSIETKLGTFWAARQLTGDNLLERPYAQVYPRVTTKSNTYNVHVRVQTLKKNTATPADEFDDSIDRVTGEFRGSYLIERYLDPNKQEFDLADANSTLGPYKVRVISSKQHSN